MKWIEEKLEEIFDCGARVTQVKAGKQYAVLGIYTTEGHLLGDLQAIAYKHGRSQFNSYPEHTEIYLLKKLKQITLQHPDVAVVLLGSLWSPCKWCTEFISFSG
jgi:hypothetical protein